MPVFFQLMDRYPTPEKLASAEHDDVLEIIHHLGLQNQRSRSVVNLAKAWLDHPPEMGKRYRRLHYPCKGDGNDVKPLETLDDESVDARVGWEIAHLPGLGAYALDSWRIFCRDRLRGVKFADEEAAANTKDIKPSSQPEWMQVVPQDKELRAYLRWRWLRVGWIWDPLTGKREKATENELKNAHGGGVIVEDDEAEKGGKIIKPATSEEE